MITGFISIKQDQGQLHEHDLGESITSKCYVGNMRENKDSVRIKIRTVKTRRHVDSFFLKQQKKLLLIRLFFKEQLPFMMNKKKFAFEIQSLERSNREPKKREEIRMHFFTARLLSIILFPLPLPN